MKIDYSLEQYVSSTLRWGRTGRHAHIRTRTRLTVEDVMLACNNNSIHGTRNAEQGLCVLAVSFCFLTRRACQVQPTPSRALRPPLGFKPAPTHKKSSLDISHRELPRHKRRAKGTPRNGCPWPPCKQLPGASYKPQRSARTAQRGSSPYGASGLCTPHSSHGTTDETSSPVPASVG